MDKNLGERGVVGENMWFIWIFPTSLDKKNHGSSTAIGYSSDPLNSLLRFYLEKNLKLRNYGLGDPKCYKRRLKKGYDVREILLPPLKDHSDGITVIVLDLDPSSINGDDLHEIQNELRGNIKKFLILAASSIDEKDKLERIIQEFSGDILVRWERYKSIEFSVLSANQIILVSSDEKLDQEIEELGAFISASVVLSRHLIILNDVIKRTEEMIDCVERGDYRRKPSQFYKKMLLEISKNINILDRSKMSEYFYTEDCRIIFKKLYERLLEDDERFVREKIEFLHTSIGHALTQMSEERSAEILGQMRSATEIAERANTALTIVNLLVGALIALQAPSYIEDMKLLSGLDFYLQCFIKLIMSIGLFFSILLIPRLVEIFVRSPKIEEDILGYVIEKMKAGDPVTIDKSTECKLDIISADLSGEEWHILLEAHKKGFFSIPQSRLIPPILDICLMNYSKEEPEMIVSSIRASIHCKYWEEDDLLREVALFLERIGMKNKGEGIIGKKEEVQRKIKELAMRGI
jgi:hypothetical protein